MNRGFVQFREGGRKSLSAFRVNYKEKKEKKKRKN